MGGGTMVEAMLGACELLVVAVLVVELCVLVELAVPREVTRQICSFCRHL